MGVDYAERYPVATFASGPTNSMRGAAYLSGLSDTSLSNLSNPIPSHFPSRSALLYVRLPVLS